MATPSELELTAPPRGAMAPVPHRVRRRIQETDDTWTLVLEPSADVELPLPGQFSMLYAPGVGEVPISTSGIDGSGRVMHTIRAVGAVSGALCTREPGSLLGSRGPLGHGWPLDGARGRDVVFVAGGIGLAPIRSGVLHVLERREEFGAVSVLVGARTPGDLLYAAELARWRRGEIEVLVTVDAATSAWRGRVGLVTTLLASAAVDPERAVAMVCGPELMARLTGEALVERGIAPSEVWLSLERNMPCGVGLCGHCQLGPVLVCRDGPVCRFDRVGPLLGVPEL